MASTTQAVYDNLENKTDNAPSTVPDSGPESKVKFEESRKRKVDNHQDAYDMSWICAECNEAECMMETTFDFLICDGRCERVFHFPCAGLQRLPPEDEDWVCKDCTQKSHQCAFCQEYGIDDEDVFQCKHDKCGLFFHIACLEMKGVDYVYETTQLGTTCDEEEKVNDISNEEKKDGDGSIEPSFASFECPAHSCWTCTQTIRDDKDDSATEGLHDQSKKRGKNKRKKKNSIQSSFQSKSGTLFRCLVCPYAFHTTCIPPPARFHELALLCHEHADTHKLPELDTENSLQSRIEDRAERKLYQLGPKAKKKRPKMTVAGANPFFTGMRPDRMTEIESKLIDILGKNDHVQDIDTNDRYYYGVGDMNFCIPITLKEEVHKKPPTYKHIPSNSYNPNHRPKKVPIGEACQCIDTCGDNCFNRLTLVECFGDGKDSNCKVGSAKCTNRSLSKRKFVKCQPKREQGKGWGLITMEDVKKGQLIQEYVGEVIDEKEKETRLKQWAEEHPNDPNFYVMALQPGWFLDARVEANLSRFINHSCDPNCRLFTVNVRGHMRNGIYSLRDIAAGEFLSYDYHFDTRHGDRFYCRCGSKKCRGTMKGGKGGVDNKELSWKEAKAQYDADEKFLVDRAATMQRSLVDMLVPAADDPKQLVSGGPERRYRDTAVRNRLFLWRNAVTGANFESRLARLGGRPESAK